MRWGLPLVVVVPMLVISELLDNREVIFPEGAALAMGVWVVGIRGWTESRWRVAALPPLFALAGVSLERLDLPRSVAALLGVTLALAALQALDSRLAPSLSAAVLPIVFGVGDWRYPVAVAVVSLVVAGGMPHAGGRHEIPLRYDPVGRYRWDIVVGAWLVICAWILVGGELWALPAAAIAPPLFVSALEWLGHGAVSLRGAMHRWALLTGAALAGSVAAEVVSVAWIAGTLAVVATLVLMRALAAAHAPALAIALIPLILDTISPLTFTGSVAAGAGALYVGALVVGGVQPALVLRP